MSLLFRGFNAAARLSRSSQVCQRASHIVINRAPKGKGKPKPGLTIISDLPNAFSGDEERKAFYQEMKADFSIDAINKKYKPVKEAYLELGGELYFSGMSLGSLLGIVGSERQLRSTFVASHLPEANLYADESKGDVIAVIAVKPRIFQYNEYGAAEIPNDVRADEACLVGVEVSSGPKTVKSAYGGTVYD